MKVGFMDEKWFLLEGAGAVAEVGEDVIYLAIAARNVGSGIAVLHGWTFRGEREGGAVAHPPVEQFRRLNRDIYIAP
ncbi:MAG TPA: hypothetical protein VIJ70_10650, partial [Gaiellaceae bacterium]